MNHDLIGGPSASDGASRRAELNTDRYTNPWLARRDVGQAYAAYELGPKGKEKGQASLQSPWLSPRDTRRRSLRSRVKGHFQARF
jgi:hypothetical protein